MEFSRPEYWSRQPFPCPGDLPNLGIKSRSLTLQEILYHLSHKGSPRCAVLSHVWLSVTPLAVSCQAPLSMGFSKQEYWSGLPCPPPGDLLNLGIEPRSPTLKVDSLLSEPPGKPKIIVFLEFPWSEVLVTQSLSHVQLFAIPWSLPRLLCPWNFLSKNTGVDCYFLLQGIFLTQGLNPGLLHCRQILYHLSHKGSNFPLSPYFLQKAVLPSTISINTVKI